MLGVFKIISESGLTRKTVFNCLLFEANEFDEKYKRELF